MLWLSRIWWTFVTLVAIWTLLFIFGPPSVQKWQINATCSVLQKVGL